ncbi:retinoschisin-like [Acanthaster planci]|uniref:Retinoschisin-like n=1 Tax=Acanthaster planci TaxID=133434 RepID=A0A8B7ZBZ3_ACAPL|nr:retinoschisin-like [Acanthaster planci]
MVNFVSIFALFVFLASRSQAMQCIIEQQLDPGTHRFRWLIRGEDPCQCTTIGMGGLVTDSALHSTKMTYYDTFLISSDKQEIQRWLTCPDVSGCSLEERLGMEDGLIPDDRITASSVRKNLANYAPQRARLGTQGWAGAWCYDDKSDSHPWIQVDFSSRVTVSGLVTQGRSDYEAWVTEYQVAYRDDKHALNHVTDAVGSPVKFPGNTDQNTHVATRLPKPLRTRLLRILPTGWHSYCCIRFDVIGCYQD